MPNYEYYCEFCDTVEDHIVPFEARRMPKPCSCGGFAHYQFSFTRNVQIQESYYDEGLGVDIHGKRHRQQVMKAMDVVEAGDKKGGARNVEKYAIGQSNPQGISHSDVQRKQEKAREYKDNQPIAFLNKEGGVRKSGRHVDNESNTKKAFKVKRIQ